MQGAIATVGFLLDAGSAGCSTSFSCAGACAGFINYAFGGVGLIAGEVVIRSAFTFDEVARATCGPTLGTPVAGSCGGTLNVSLSAGAYFLECRAHGVVAILVGGFCQGFIS